MFRQITLLAVVALILPFWSWPPLVAWAGHKASLLEGLSANDVLLVAHPDGRIVYNKNASKKYAPASTLKLLTSLAAIHHLGLDYRFQTEFYEDGAHNVTIKGYGDPLLISEVWQEIAHRLAPRLKGCKDLILDDSHFERGIRIPGVNRSTNPYDAPVGALCANFNTVFLEQDATGKIVSAEPQTPITPLVRRHQGLQEEGKGRYAFTHRSEEGALYAGELFVHFMGKNGTHCQGNIRLGAIGPGDRLLYTYKSLFPLEEGLRRMLKFSNNFMANQILIALGAHVYGPPGTLDKGTQVLNGFAEKVLCLHHISLVEGSGISRKNRLSAMDMLAVLEAFAPYRSLLSHRGHVWHKGGTLKGLRTGAGFVECEKGKSYAFVVYMEGRDRDIETFIDDLADDLDKCMNK
ncbi:MAG: D-alanyl-D-alanine carboxypeptidase [Thermodesulfobacteriota bacterium]|nr:D-alanyl-D-alanine carboxypeptidase [Thermodesulfobacteriota bacterium]